MIGVLEKACEHFHHEGVKAALVGRQFTPILHVGVMT
jgi:hypothetical protein